MSAQMYGRCIFCTQVKSQMQHRSFSASKAASYVRILDCFMFLTVLITICLVQLVAAKYKRLLTHLHLQSSGSCSYFGKTRSLENTPPAKHTTEKTVSNTMHHNPNRGYGKCFFFEWLQKWAWFTSGVLGFFPSSCGLLITKEIK